MVEAPDQIVLDACIDTLRQAGISIATVRPPAIDSGAGVPGAHSGRRPNAMRPYLAVLKDCFREAFASRILWLLTGLITLVLFVGLAPFTLLEESAARFQRNEFRNGPEFLKYLASLETSHEATAARRSGRGCPTRSATGCRRRQRERQRAGRSPLRHSRRAQRHAQQQGYLRLVVWTPRMLTPEAKRLAGTRRRESFR